MNYTDFGVSCAEELDQDEWSLSGVNFISPKGGSLVVLGVSPSRWGVRKDKKYIVRCSFCQQDDELYGDGLFISVKHALLKGIPPCGCSKNRRLSDHTARVEVRRALQQKGYDLVGFVGDFKTANTTRVIASCDKHGEWGTSLITHIINGTGCPKCRDDLSSLRVKRIGGIPGRADNFKEDSYYIAKFLETGAFHEGTIFCRNGRGREWFYKCPICSVDEFSKNKLCAGVFRSTASELMKGHRSCRCKRCPDYTLEQYTYRCKQVCLSEGLEFIRVERKNSPTGRGIQHGNYVEYKCKEHGPVKVGLVNFFSGNRCGKCKSKRMSKTQLLAAGPTVISMAKEKAKSLGYSFQGITTKKWQGYKKSRIIFNCEKHGDWDFYPSSIHNFSGCPICAGKNQKQTYINLVVDQSTPVAIKFGIARVWQSRLKTQQAKSLFDVENIGVWGFETSRGCKAAERECKQTLRTGVLSDREMRDGWTETVSVLDLEKVITIYEKHGGKRIK